MRLIFILSIIATFFLLSLRSRLAGLYTYWWFAIFRPHEWVWSSTINSLRLPLVAAMLLVIPSLLQKKIPKLNNSIAFLMFIWLFLVFIADSLNGCSTMTVIRTSTVFNLFVLFYIVLLSSVLIENPKHIFWLIFVLAASIAAHSGKGGIHAILTGANNYGATNLSGLFSGSNAYALGTGMLLFFMIFSYQHINSRLVFETMDRWYNKKIFLTMAKVLIAILILGSFYNIISLQSRGSFIATVAGLFIWVIMQKKGLLIITVSSLIILSVGTASLTFLPEGYVERIEKVFTEDEELDKSAASRPHFWKTSIEIVKEHPTGIGPGCYPAYYNQFDTTNGFYGLFRSVHSSHFQMLVDSGYLGLFIWVLLFFISYTKLWKIKHIIKSKIDDEVKSKFYTDLANMLICSQTVFLLGGAFYEFAYNDITWITFALVISIENLIEKELKNRKPPERQNQRHFNF